MRESFDLKAELKLQIEREIKMKQYLYRKATQSEAKSGTSKPLPDHIRNSSNIGMDEKRKSLSRQGQYEKQRDTQNTLTMTVLGSQGEEEASAE